MRSRRRIVTSWKVWGPGVWIALLMGPVCVPVQAAQSSSATYTDIHCAPGRVAVDGAGQIHVTDPWGQRVVTLEADGDFSSYFIPSATLQPLAIALLPGDGIALSDPIRGAVDLYDASRVYQGSLGLGAGEFILPSDMAVNPATGDLFVVDTHANQVRVYSAAGVFLRSFGSLGSGAGQFHCPSGIAILSGASEVYVGDQANFRVQVFGLDGTYRRTLGARGSLPGQFVRIQAVAADRTGPVFVADLFHNCVQILNGSTGAFQVQLGDMGLAPSQGLLQPCGVALDLPRMRLLVASHNTEAIEVYDLTGIIPDPASVPDWALLR